MPSHTFFLKIATFFDVTRFSQIVVLLRGFLFFKKKAAKIIVLLIAPFFPLHFRKIDLASYHTSDSIFLQADFDNFFLLRVWRGTGTENVYSIIVNIRYIDLIRIVNRSPSLIIQSVCLLFVQICFPFKVNDSSVLPLFSNAPLSSIFPHLSGKRITSDSRKSS